MNVRDQIRMTDDERAAYLRERRTVVVATNGAGGEPHMAAMWFATVDGKVAFWTYRKSQKVVNLRRDPRMSCLLESGEEYSELRGLLIRGVAELVEEPERVEPIGTVIATRYHGELDQTQRAGVAEESVKRLAVVVHPRTITSWDHRKLPARSR